jgi:hypothetical protein
MIIGKVPSYRGRKEIKCKCLKSVSDALPEVLIITLKVT